MTDENNDSKKKEYPIENGFPIEKVNKLAEKEAYAGIYYRPIYGMHKWWARRMGTVFRSIALYSLFTDEEKIRVTEPGSDSVQTTLSGQNSTDDSIICVDELSKDVTHEDPSGRWQLYGKDVTLPEENKKKVLDPFMGGGTSLVEASRFGAEVHGYDLNPVAWFVTKKELEAGKTDADELKEAYKELAAELGEHPNPKADDYDGGGGDITQYYKTTCPHGHDADLMYAFWVRQVPCGSQNCDNTIDLFNDYRIGKGKYDNKGQYWVYCPDCEGVVLVDDWSEEQECPECESVFTPNTGVVSRGSATCQECGSRENVVDLIPEDGYDKRLYAVEYYCSTCDREDDERGNEKGYKPVGQADKELYEEAKEEWKNSNVLQEYAPDEEIVLDGKETSRLLNHRILQWKNMFNARQLLSLTRLLKAIDELDVEDNIKEYLLLAATNTLCTNNMMTGYNVKRNGVQHIFKSNSFDPPQRPTEGNIWGASYGRGTFYSIFNQLLDAVEYANNPTERRFENGSVEETKPYNQSIGEAGFNVEQADSRSIDAENEYDVILTDPPYYDNIIYSELSDFFYVWQKQLLDYDGFQHEHTNRAESIVANPAVGKDEEDFEAELKEAFTTFRQALKDDGILAFTYHHSNTESWGKLLTALCDAGFDVRAAYPISADLADLDKRGKVEFDIIIVARPMDPDDREMVKWSRLSDRIRKRTEELLETLREERDIAEGDAKMVTMGAAFSEYAKHHGKVFEGAERLTATEVLDRMDDIVAQAEGPESVYLNLLGSEGTVSSNRVKKECMASSATEKELEQRKLIRLSGDDYEVLDWEDHERFVYLQDKYSSESPITPLEAVQLARHYVGFNERENAARLMAELRLRDDVDLDEINEWAEKLARRTGDETYTDVTDLGSDTSIAIDSNPNPEQQHLDDIDR